MQIFSHNPRQWHKTKIPKEEADRFTIMQQKHDLKVFIHASYLINLASISETVLQKSISLLSYELSNADKLGVKHVVLHTGSAKGEDGTLARSRAVKSILKAVAAKKFKSSILLENTAGHKGSITSSISALAEIMNECNGDSVSGICLDTCHAFSAGYDLATGKGIDKLIGEIKEHIGLDKLKLIHLNDSKKPVGSGVDRHEHIGKGFIGMKGFTKLLSDKRISGIPLILETPKHTEDDDHMNLRKVHEILSKNT